MGIDPKNIRFERMPSEIDRNFGWDIKRVPADGTIKLISLSSSFLGIRTHFFRGRTVPCLTEHCEACSSKMLSRWHGYLLTLLQPVGSRVIFEFTPPAAVQLEEIRKLQGTLRGLVLEGGRSQRRANGKVTVVCKGQCPEPAKLASEIEVWPVLSHIWGLDSPDVDTIDMFSENDLSEHEKLVLYNGRFQQPAADTTTDCQHKANGKARKGVQPK